MSKYYQVQGFSDISPAAEWLDHNLLEHLDDKEDRIICSLMTEELLWFLLHRDQTMIMLSIRGVIHKRIEITSRGEDVGYGYGDEFLETDEEKHLEAEINKNLLNQYSSRIVHDYSYGSNRFTIDILTQKRAELQQEVFDFYRQNEESSGHTLSILFHIAKKHPLMTAFGIVNKAVKHTAVLFIPVYASRLVDSCVQYDSFFEPMVGINILMMLTALAVNLICAAIDGKTYFHFARNVESALKMAIVRKLQFLTIKYYNDTPVGKILSKLISDVQFVKQLINEQLTTVLHLCIDIVFVCATAIRQLPVMLFLYAVVIPVMLWLMHHHFPGIRDSKARMRKQTEKSNSAFQEMLTMGQLTRAHGLQQNEYRRILSKIRYVQVAANEQDWRQLRFNIATFATVQGSQLLCLCIAVYMAFQGRITIGTVILFKSLFEALINSMQKFLDELPMITQELDSLDSINEILYVTDTEKDGTEKLETPVHGDVTFDNVSFGYSHDNMVLKNVSFQIPAGKTAAFIGKSGSGKSTILNLLLGFYAPQAGQVMIDGKDVNELQKNDYRRYLAVVPQNPTLFSGTLWENLICGLRYVSVSGVMEALKCTGLEGMITGHSDGLNQMIQEGGQNLSGGQRQRIAIVRALLRHPRIILLDEATSALDTQSELEVQRSIEAMMGTCTMIIVAHRLNTIQKADIVYSVEDGNVVRQK